MKTFSCKILLILICSFFVTVNSMAFTPEEYLPDKQEQRAKNLFMQVRCLVCKGQVIGNSDTQIAYQLRKLIRQKIVAGQNDQKIKTYLISKYGQDIITSPPLNITTFFLWLLPIIFAVSGIVVILRLLKKHR